MPTHPSRQDGPPTTRTRLPEGTGTTGGTTRRPGRPGRNLVTVLGVVVLLIAAIAFADRGGGHSGARAGHSGTPGAASHDASPEPTAPTGTQPVAGHTDGVATGYAHSGQGAQSAAANYAVALGSSAMFATGPRHAIVSTVYAPGAVGGQEKELDSAFTDPGFLKRVGLHSDGSVPGGLTFVSRSDPAGTRLDAYTGTDATVEVWYSSLFGLAGEGSTDPVAESWYTDTYRLTWAAGDWKVVSVHQKEGPTPVGYDQRASSAKAMSNAVTSFGGFTYAR
jgi:hypothetical protein